MMEKLQKKHVAKNMTLSILAQAVSLVTSVVLGFFIPKYVPELQYGYWQIYVLYVGYVGLLHFGLLDGIVLRYAQYNYEEIDKPRLRSQFQNLFVFVSLLAAVGILVACFFLTGYVKIIVILISVAAIVQNLNGYTSYMFQITNRISKYVIITIANRAIYGMLVVVLLICKVQDFYYYAMVDIASYLVSIVIGILLNRGMYWGKSLPWKERMRETKVNVACGILLLIANFTSNFLVGGAKMAVQWQWDVLTFGKVSFAFSVLNIFLTFVTAISVVLFPSLKRMDEAQLPGLYSEIRKVITPIMFIVILFYFPGAWVLARWLPNYSESLVYLAILCPVCIYSAKVGLLTNNYLKAYRKEKLMMWINAGVAVLGFSLFLVGAFALRNINFILYSLIAVIVLKSVLSELAVAKTIGIRLWFDFAAELILTAVFVVCAQFLSLLWGGVAYLCALVVYLIVYRKNVIYFFRKLKHIFRSKKRMVAAEPENADIKREFDAGDDFKAE